jgi:short-subunit dehydrogenase
MKRIVITGGSDGAGKALAENLSRDFKVSILARDEAKPRAVAEHSALVQLRLHFKYISALWHYFWCMVLP